MTKPQDHLKKKKIRDVSKPIISYVMVTCNGGLTNTIRAVGSLYRENTVKPYDLIVVDNATNDGTTAWLKSEKITSIRISEMVSYGEALNKGLKIASGDYLSILNNDIVVTQGWEDVMLSCLTNAGKIEGVDKIGIVGPMSNFVGYEQKVPEDALQATRYSDDDQIIHNFGIQWFNNAWAQPEKFRRVGFLSGFCWVMTRACYEAVGDFAEDLKPGGFEDNDYVYRADKLGYASYIAIPSFVHHKGNETFKKFNMKESRAGMANRIPFFKKHMEDRKKTLCIGVKGDFHIQKDLDERFGHLADELIVNGDRELLWNHCKHKGCDWILILEENEYLEPRIKREHLEKLMNNPNPQIYSWSFRIATMWDTPEQQRVDGYFKDNMEPRLVRNLPNFHIGDKYVVPEFPSYNCKSSPYRIQDFSLLEKESRIGKYDKLTKEHPEWDVEYILDDGATIVKFDPDLTLGLVTIMKNEMRLPDCHLERYLSVYGSMYDEMIIVDTGSTDDSIEVAEFYGATVIKADWKDDFAAARNIGLDACTTKYVMHSDPDEDMKHAENPDEMRFRRYLESSCLGLRIPIIHPKPGHNGTSDTFKCRVFKNLPEIRYKNRIHEEVESAVYATKGHGVVAPLPHDKSIPFCGIIHHGFSRNPNELGEKMKYYEELNRMILEEDPDNYSANYTIGIQMATDGNHEESLKHYGVAMKNDPENSMPYIMACHSRMQQAKSYLEQALKNLPQSNNRYGIVVMMLRELEKISPKLPTIGVKPNG